MPLTRPSKRHRESLWSLWGVRLDDEGRLRELGYEQELQRGCMGCFDLFGVSFNVISVSTGITGGYGVIGLIYGGPVSIFWGWMVVAIFSSSVALGMSEVCSAYPTAGGLYYLSNWLAGRRYKKILCYLTGWLNMVGVIMLLVGVCSGISNLLSTMVLISTGTAAGGGYDLDNNHTYAVYCGFMLLAGLLASTKQSISIFILSVGTFWQLVAMPIFWLTLVCLVPKRKPWSYVFLEWQPNTDVHGISSPFRIFLTGMLMSQWTLIGYDASYHMIEETTNAQLSGPLSIISAFFFSALYGVLAIICFGLSTIDEGRLLDPDAPAGGDSVAQIVWDVLASRYGSGKGTVVLLCVPLLANFFCLYASILAGSRMIFALSRDHALPGSRFWIRINRYTSSPINACWLLVTLATIVGLPQLYGSAALGAMIPISVMCLLISYCIPLALRVLNASRFNPGPFNFAFFGPIIVVVALMSSIVNVVVTCMPTTDPVVFSTDITQSTVNWTPLVFTCAVLLVLAYYFCPYYGARAWFNGPVPNVQLQSGALVLGSLAPAAPRARRLSSLTECQTLSDGTTDLDGSSGFAMSGNHALGHERNTSSWAGGLSFGGFGGRVGSNPSSGGSLPFSRFSVMSNQPTSSPFVQPSRFSIIDLLHPVSQSLGLGGVLRTTSSASQIPAQSYARQSVPSAKEEGIKPVVQVSVVAQRANAAPHDTRKHVTH